MLMLIIEPPALVIQQALIAELRLRCQPSLRVQCGLSSSGYIREHPNVMRPKSVHLRVSHGYQSDLPETRSTFWILSSVTHALTKGHDRIGQEHMSHVCAESYLLVGILWRQGKLCLCQYL